MNRAALLFIYDDYKSTYDELLLRINHPILYNRRMHNILTIVFQTFHGLVPESKLFTLRNCSINLRGDQ